MKAGLDRSIARGTYTLIAARYTRRLEGAAGGRRRSTDEGVARSGCARPTESPASLDSPSKSKGEGWNNWPISDFIENLSSFARGHDHRPRGPDQESLRGRRGGRKRQGRKKLFLLFSRLFSSRAIPRGPFLRPNYPSLFTKISATKFASAVKVIDSSYVVIELLGH